MSTKSIVLDILEENRGKSVSGQELADMIGVSRTSIWKAVKSLQEEGHKIDTKTNEGYQLKNDSDKLSEEGIRIYLHDKYKDIKIFVYEVTDSTNKQAKLYGVNEDNPDDNGIKIFVAEEQTNGRGRLGKSFYSPKSSGLYLSILIRPKQAESVQMITIAAAVGVCRAIKELYDIQLDIKWVNDLYHNGKKICGILTEAVTNFETGAIDNIVIGIGINCTTKDFPDDITNIADSLDNDNNLKNRGINIVRNELTAKITENIAELAENLGDSVIIDEYRKFSFMKNKIVSFIQKGEEFTGKVEDINDSGNLIVKMDNDKTMVLSSGEVSVKGEWKL